MKRIIILTIMLACVHLTGLAQHVIRGSVLNASDRTPLVGATVKIKNTEKGVSTDTEGRFFLTADSSAAVLVISYLGFDTKELSVKLPQEGTLIMLDRKTGTLQEVVVSTGYQEIPKERATGSFVRADNELLNRRVSTDILSRLEDVVPGMVFNRKGSSSISFADKARCMQTRNPSSSLTTSHLMAT